jgi:hypothetical protein
MEFASQMFCVFLFIYTASFRVYMWLQHGETVPFRLLVSVSVCVRFVVII